MSRTFHGRDVFAPAAAYLAAGVPLERLGPAVADPVLEPIPGSRLEGGVLVGRVLDVDRFGNLLTSIEGARLAALAGDGPLAVEVAGRPVGGLVEAYADGRRAAGRDRRVDRAPRDLRAGRQRSPALGAGRGAPVRVRR